MKQEPTATKISLLFDIAALAALLIWYHAAAQAEPITDLRGLLSMSPPLFGVPGLILAINGRLKHKSILSLALILINSVFISWWPIVMMGVPLLFGP